MLMEQVLHRSAKPYIESPNGNKQGNSSLHFTSGPGRNTPQFVMTNIILVTAVLLGACVLRVFYYMLKHCLISVYKSCCNSLDGCRSKRVFDWDRRKQRKALNVNNPTSTHSSQIDCTEEPQPANDDDAAC